MEKETKPVSIRGLDRNLWKLARVEAVKEGKSVGDWLNEAIKEKLDKFKGGKK